MLEKQEQPKKKQLRKQKKRKTIVFITIQRGDDRRQTA